MTENDVFLCQTAHLDAITFSFELNWLASICTQQCSSSALLRRKSSKNEQKMSTKRITWAFFIFDSKTWDLNVSALTCASQHLFVDRNKIATKSFEKFSIGIVLLIVSFCCQFLPGKNCQRHKVEADRVTNNKNGSEGEHEKSEKKMSPKKSRWFMIEHLDIHIWMFQLLTLHPIWLPSFAFRYGFLSAFFWPTTPTISFRIFFCQLSNGKSKKSCVHRSFIFIFSFSFRILVFLLYSHSNDLFTFSAKDTHTMSRFCLCLCQTTLNCIIFVAIFTILWCVQLRRIPKTCNRMRMVQRFLSLNGFDEASTHTSTRIHTKMRNHVHHNNLWRKFKI